MKLRITFGLLFILLPLLSVAAGLGDIQVKSSLNQQFKAIIPIVDLANLPPGAVTATLGSETEFTAVGLKKDFILSNLTFTVTQNKNQQFYILITSAHPIAKPVLTFLLKLTWPNGKVLREYTVFLDPINYDTASSSSPASQPAQPRKVIAPPALTYGPTNMQDNLWAIAEHLLPNIKATIDQLMIAILKLNPDAFIQNNINGLKAGYTLTLPNTAQANAISDTAARQLIVAQNTVWQTQTQTTVLPASRAQSVPSAAPPSPQTKLNALSLPSLNSPSSLEPASEDQMFENESPSATPTNALGNQIALNPDQSNTKLASLENEVAVSNAAMQAAVGANKSLELEISDLRTQLTALRTQLEEKDRTIAALQQNIAQQQGGHLPSSNVQPANVIPAVANDVNGQPIKTSAWHWMLIPLIIVLLFLVLYLFKEKLQGISLGNYVDALKNQFSSVTEKMKQKAPRMNVPKQDRLEEIIIPQIKPITPEPAPVTTQISSEQQPPALVISETVPANTAMLDIVDEVDVYLAYGRYEKAETLLRSSLKSNPDQPELRLKLLEIDLSRKDKVAFDQELQSLGVLTDLPPILQSKLTKLFEGWKNIDLTASSTPEMSVPDEKTSFESAPKAPVEASSSAENSRTMEFDGDLSRLYSESPVPVPPKNEEISLENEKSLSLPEENIELKPDTENLTTRSEMQQTQLSLASTYIDMGDLEEARSLLNSVTENGNEEQKKEAQALINKIEQQKTS